jgi:MoxR-like ATPase
MGVEVIGQSGVTRVTYESKDAAVLWMKRLQAEGYIAGRKLAKMIAMALDLKRPLLLEGPAGVGKTALAPALASVLQREMIRLQCFEGIEAEQALYDWNYHKQLFDISARQSTDVFSAEYLLPRPLLQALQSEKGAVLLIDEVDRSDESFEAMLLEFMADYQISVPEWKTVRAQKTPVVILTSNRMRPLSDALRRRCLYYRFDWPEEAEELNIVRMHLPAIEAGSVLSVVRAVRRIRSWELNKPPGIAETIDWALAFQASGADWSAEWVGVSLGCIVKDAEDMEIVRSRIGELFEVELRRIVNDENDIRVPSDQALSGFAEEDHSEREGGSKEADRKQGASAASSSEGQLVSESLFGHPPSWIHRLPHRPPFVRSKPSLKKSDWFGRKHDIDLRKTVRLWNQTGRPGVHYRLRQSYRRSCPLVVLWDVSGSMASYIDLYFPWVYGLARRFDNIGIFPFGTRILEITALLRASFFVARSRLSELEQLWAGGTEIGTVLSEWIERYSARWLRSNATFLVISDGWDVGSTERLTRALRHIRSYDARIVWMNPLMATPGFEPKTRALRAAKPYLERMVSGHSIHHLLNL